MEYVICIFLLGLMVTLLVAKGLMEAGKFARTELDRLDVVASRVENQVT